MNIRRRATYPGDLRHLTDPDDYRNIVGPDMRGIVWKPCHVDYDHNLDNSIVIFRPLTDEELQTAIHESKVLNP